MTDLIDEIQLDLEHEKQTKLIKTIAKIFLSVSILVIFTITIYVIWQNRYITSHETISKEMELARIELDNKNLDKASEKFTQILNNKTSGFWELAALELAKLDKNNNIKMLEEIVYESKNQVFIESAALKLSNIFLEKKDFPKTQYYLSKINLNNGIWKFTAKELNALLLIEQGKKDEAKKLLISLVQDQSAPSKIHKEAEALLSIIENQG